MFGFVIFLTSDDIKKMKMCVWLGYCNALHLIHLGERCPSLSNPLKQEPIKQR